METAEARAFRRQELTWLLTNIESRLHYVRLRGKGIPDYDKVGKAKHEAEMSLLYKLRNDVDVRLKSFAERPTMLALEV